MPLLKKISGLTKMKERKISSIGKEVIRVELDSIKKLYSNFSNSFETIVKTILNALGILSIVQHK